MSVTGHLPPYNGTVFNLTGAIQLDMNIVNTDITAIWVWALGEETLEIQNTTSLYQIASTTFRPLTTYSSGLNVTVMSSDNSVYIAENSGYTY